MYLSASIIRLLWMERGKKKIKSQTAITIKRFAPCTGNVLSIIFINFLIVSTKLKKSQIKVILNLAACHFLWIFRLTGTFGWILNIVFVSRGEKKWNQRWQKKTQNLIDCMLAHSRSIKTHLLKRFENGSPPAAPLGESFIVIFWLICTDYYQCHIAMMML